jgi:hypothetical protein
MATKRSHSKWAVAAIVAGVALTAIKVVGAVSYLVQKESRSYLIAGGAVVTVVAAMQVPLAERRWQRSANTRHPIGAVVGFGAEPNLLCRGRAYRRCEDQANRDRQAVAQQIELKRAAVNEGRPSRMQTKPRQRPNARRGEGRIAQASKRGRTPVGHGWKLPWPMWREPGWSHLTLKRGDLLLCCRSQRSDPALSASRTAGRDLGPRTAAHRGRSPPADAAR